MPGRSARAIFRPLKNKSIRAGLGIGKALLRQVLALAVEQRDRLGCVGVVTDAKPEAVSFYESLGFVPVDGVREGLLHGEPLPMFLAIDTIAAVLDG